LVRVSRRVGWGTDLLAANPKPDKAREIIAAATATVLAGSRHEAINRNFVQPTVTTATERTKSAPA
jgi:hypothetical protein